MATAVSSAGPNPSLLRVVRNGASSFHWIKDGREGSFQTAAEMARLVREAAVKDQGLEKFAAQILINGKLDSHSEPDEAIDAIFRYTQQIKYISDSSGQGSFDAVASARDTIEKGYGDCDDLSVLLASLLALVGFRPSFVLAKMREESKGFDHVYVQVISRQGRVALDPTTRKFGMGWESPRAIEKVNYPIFKGVAASYLAGIETALPALIQAGTTIGMGLLTPNPQASASHNAQIAAGQGFDATDKQVAAFLVTLNTKANAGILTADDYLAAQNAVSTLAAEAQAQSGVAYVRSQWAAESPRYQTWLQALGSKVVAPSSAVAALTGSGAISAAAGSIPSSVSSSLPVLLIAGIGLILLLKR